MYLVYFGFRALALSLGGDSQTSANTAVPAISPEMPTMAQAKRKKRRPKDKNWKTKVRASFKEQSAADRVSDFRRSFGHSFGCPSLGTLFAKYYIANVEILNAAIYMRCICACTTRPFPLSKVEALHGVEIALSSVSLSPCRRPFEPWK